MMILPRVCVVVLNYNGAEDTIECLASLEKIRYDNYYIVVVDNFSSDSSPQKINEYFQKHDSQSMFFNSLEEASKDKLLQPRLTYIQLNKNGGYGYGNNIGIRYALNKGADYVLILNNDTVVDTSFLLPLVQACEDDKDIGIVTSRIYFHDKPSVIWSNGGKLHSWTGKLEMYDFKKTDSSLTRKRESSFVSGCLWLVPRRIFKEVGFIKEDYFMYVEDLEFCQRVLSAGYKLKVVSQSHIWHKVGRGTGGAFSDFSVYWRVRNMNVFLSQREVAWWVKWISIFLFNIKFFLRLALKAQSGLVIVYFQATLHAFMGKSKKHVA